MVEIAYCPGKISGSHGDRVTSIQGKTQSSLKPASVPRFGVVPLPKRDRLSDRLLQLPFYIPIGESFVGTGARIPQFSPGRGSHEDPLVPDSSNFMAF